MDQDNRPIRPICPQGLSDLSVADERGCVVDIVAIHGLNSSPTQCWQEGGTHWLRDFLPGSLPQARVFVFGYNANVVNDASRMRIKEHAQNLLENLRDERQGAEQRALIFICHSLGGILVKQALVIANDAQNPLFSDIRRSTYGICFLGTPHRGSDAVSWGKILINMSKVAFKDPKKHLLESLKKDSHELSDLAQSFASLLPELQIVSCIEQRETPVSTLLRPVKVMVVDAFSAQMGVPNERRVYLDRDHRRMCKFTDEQDPSYRQVFNRIEEMVKQAPPVIAARYSQPLGSPAHPFEPVFMVPFGRNEDFVGRQGILDKLRGLLSPKPGLQSRAGLWGLGGTGKTTIAIEFCHQERLAKPESHVFWLYGHSKEAFETSYLDLHSKMRLSAHYNDNDDEARLGAVRDWLGSRSSGDWLIVVDNFDNLNINLGAHLPITKGAILFTSRDRQLVGYDGYLSANSGVKIEEMSDEEALQTFSQLLGDSGPAIEQTSRPLLTLLGNLPLAIAQAAAYIRGSPGLTIAEYTKVFIKCEENQSFLLGKALRSGLDMDRRSSQAVMTTWRVTMGRIGQESPRSVKLLKFLSFLSTEEIPEYLIKEACNSTQDSLQFIETLAPLLQFALLRRLENESYRVHRLVGFWVRVSLSEEEHESQVETITELLECLLPDDPADDLSDCTRLLPHITRVLGHVEKSHHSQHLPLLDYVGNIYQTKGEYEDAKVWYQRALDSCEETFGTDHPSTLGTVNNMAIVFGKQGEYDQALEWFQRVFDGKEKTLGKDHPSTLNVINNMAVVFDSQGEYDRALEWHQRALDSREKSLRENHPSTLGTVGNIAIVFCKRGEYDRALEWFQRALEGYEKTLGKDHPSTVSTVNNMAIVFDSQGEYDQALEWYQRALGGLEKAFGRDHPSTLDTVGNIAAVFDRRGEYDRALEWFRRALDSYEKTFGRDHRSALSTVEKMALVFDKQGDYDRALERFQRSLGGWEKTLGRDHPDTLHTIKHIAMVFENQGKYDRALEWYQRALDSEEKSLGRNHPSTLDTVSSVATALRKQGGYDRALEGFQRALDGFEKTFGRDHPSTLETIDNIAIVFEDRGEYDRALEWCQRALDGCEEKLGNTHRLTVAISSHLATLRQGSQRSQSPVNSDQRSD